MKDEKVITGAVPELTDGSGYTPADEKDEAFLGSRAESPKVAVLPASEQALEEEVTVVQGAKEIVSEVIECVLVLLGAIISLITRL